MTPFWPSCPTHGQPAQPPWQLALVTIWPFAAGLSDRQAAHAVRRRIDWKVRPNAGNSRHPGFHASVLSSTLSI